VVAAVTLHSIAQHTTAHHIMMLLGYLLRSLLPSPLTYNKRSPLDIIIKDPTGGGHFS
jgi:hypothetical protein